SFTPKMSGVRASHDPPFHHPITSKIDRAGRAPFTCRKDILIIIEKSTRDFVQWLFLSLQGNGACGITARLFDDRNT
ncbi:hypothetical protein, partial [Planktomarina sp.]|uniref:hypothetical protein n=1 Tax=Planktomarina sp. TaxID=2024851 RepID=UPI0032614D5D